MTRPDTVTPQEHQRVAQASHDLVADLITERTKTAALLDALRHVLGYIVGGKYLEMVLTGKQHPQHEHEVCCVCHARAAIALAEGKEKP